MNTLPLHPYNVILYQKPVPFPGSEQEERTWVQIQHYLMMQWLYDPGTRIRNIFQLPLGRHSIVFASPLELFLDSLRASKDFTWITPRGPKQSLEHLLSMRYANCRFEKNAPRPTKSREEMLAQGKPVSIFSLLESTIGFFYAQVVVTLLDGIEKPIEEAAQQLEALARQHREEDESAVRL